MVTWLPALRKPARSGPTYHHFVSKTEVGAALRQKKSSGSMEKPSPNYPMFAIYKHSQAEHL